MTTACAHARPQELRRLRDLPKVDLHCHLDGALRPRTVWELAKERKVKLPAGSLEELKAVVQVGAACASLTECLRVFEILYPLLRDAAALERVAYELCEDSAAENIRHLEVRFAPMLNAKAGFSPEGAVEAVLKGLRRGLKDFGVTSGVIICLFRSHGPKESRAAFAALKRAWRKENGLAAPGVVGLDLAGDESRFPLSAYASFFEEAAALGIPATCHAGEAEGSRDLEDALALGVRRIGHALRLAGDDRLLGEVVRRGVALELNLTSNLRTRSAPSLRDHPALAFHRAGARLSFNTDDRGLFGIDLTHEYAQALGAGFTLDEVRKVARAAPEQAFLPAADLARLATRFQEAP